MRVVIVDNQAAFRAAARELLERRGHVVVAEAATGDEALAAISRTDPELVLMDVRLGNESGLDLTRAVTNRWPDLAVLLMTADSSAPAEDVRASGAAAHVSKKRLHVTNLDALVRPNPTSSDDLDQIRAALAAREEGCWERIEEELSELVEVHGVAADQIRSRIDAALRRI